MKTTWFKFSSDTDNERGSLALEQVLFIGAVVGLTLGVFTFYDTIGNYFSSFAVTAAPDNFGADPTP